MVILSLPLIKVSCQLLVKEFAKAGTINSDFFLGVRPASYTHNFTRGRKKLASVSPRGS